LIEAAQKLEKGGANFLVMPCNSLHIFIEQIRAAVKIPVLSILEETAGFLKQKEESRVGILATTTTIKNKLYEQKLSAVNIEQVVPDGFQQAKIGKIINNLVLNRHGNKDREELLEIIKGLSGKGVKTVILACTDLQLLIPQFPDMKIYDTMKIFAQATVEEILRE
jgi:aspartate racemase